VTGGLLLAGLAVIGFFWAMNAQGPHESAQAKNDAVTETNKPDQSQPPREQDEPLDPEKLGQQKEKEQTQQKAEDIRRQQEAEQRKIEERRAGEERNLEQREKLLETLDAKKREEAAQLEEEVKKHQKDVADIGRKIAQIEKTLGISRKMVNGVMVENQTSNPLDPRVKQLQSQIGKLQKDQTTAKSEEADAKKKRDTRMAQLEQERRRILVKFPVQGDPELAEHKGFLYKSDELIKIKAFEDEHGTPQRAADYYIQSLLDSRVLEKAEFLRVSAVAPPAEALLYKGQLKAYKTAHYQVRYVSKAGLVNDREVYVSVFALEDGNWYVSPAMKKLEVLGGLK